MSQSRAGCLAKSYPEERISVWMGHQPSLPDSLAVIGPSRLSPDVVHAFGHGHVGMTGAPMTGKVIADLVSGRPPSTFPRSAPPGSRDPVASPSLRRQHAACSSHSRAFRVRHSLFRRWRARMEQGYGARCWPSGPEGQTRRSRRRDELQRSVEVLRGRRDRILKTDIGASGDHRRARLQFPSAAACATRRIRIGEPPRAPLQASTAKSCGCATPLTGRAGRRSDGRGPR
jgi:hypothetical protein